MFSEISPWLLGQDGSCSTANSLGNTQKTFYKNFFTSYRPRLYFFQNPLNPLIKGMLPVFFWKRLFTIKGERRNAKTVLPD